MTRISLKGDEYRTNENIIVYTDDSGVTRDANRLYIGGPSKSFYEVDERFGDWRIVWLETDAEVYPYRAMYVPCKTRIRVNKDAIKNNCMYNKTKQYDKFNKVLTVIDGDTVKQTMLVEIDGPSFVIHDPNNKDYTVWIETSSEIKTFDNIS